MIFYIDGGCAPTNPGPGGWGIFIEDTNVQLYGGEAWTTNNRMELMGLIKALELCALTGDTIYADSDYVRLGATEWIKNWKRDNWMRGSKPIKNQDLWQIIDSLMTQKHVSIVRVDGHSNDVGNDVAHALAELGRYEFGFDETLKKNNPLQFNSILNKS